VTNDRPHDARPSSLHRRLTVALATAADRARLADALAGDPEAVGGTPIVVGADHLRRAAEGYAQERAEDRRALRARLDAVAARTMHDCDTARHQLEHLQGWQRTLHEGAAWATDLHADLARHLDAVEAARAVLDERRAEQRDAQHDLDRVLEQRTAAAAAIEEADRELAEVSGTGLDESELRRELEAAGRSVREAEAAHAAARRRLDDLQLEATGLQLRREASGSPAERWDATHQPGIARVRAALAALRAETVPDEVDPDALELVQAWRDLHADLREVGGPLQGVTEQEIDAARRRLAAASAALAALDAEASASTLTPQERAALDAAHTEVLAAEEQLMGRRRVTGGARKRLEAAHATERALLDQHGFAGYLDVVLSGGRAGAAHPERPAAEREHFEATLALEALERGAITSPALQHLHSERARLLAMVHDLLGVDPGDDVEGLLLAHAPAPRSARAALAAALRAVDVHPVGTSLEAAASAFLADHDADASAPGVALGEDLEALDARAAVLHAELPDAQAEVDRTAEAWQLARSSVDAFEGELTLRAGEDLQRMKRFAAAEQLRAQIDAVAGTLRRAEEAARHGLEAADRAVAAAEGSFDQTAAEVSELARRARTLAEELPIDRRPEGDPLRTLPDLAEGLRAHAEVLQPEIHKAEAAVESASAELEEAMAACRLANAGGDGPQPEDVTDALHDLLQMEGQHVVVLDEPFGDAERTDRAALLEIVREASHHRPLVLLTDDPEVLSWAIELPADDAAALPADALLNRLRRTNHGLNPAVLAADAPVDITSPTTFETDQLATPTGPRWAGRR
jgi:hypothetical protein